MTDKKPQHTPGPWKVIRGELGGTNDQMVYVVDANSKAVTLPIKISWPIKWDEGEQILANAHLIAAAPDLLEAAKNALSLIEQKPQSSMTEQAIQWEEELRAAIAKAEGK